MVAKPTPYVTCSRREQVQAAQLSGASLVVPKSMSRSVLFFLCIFLVFSLIAEAALVSSKELLEGAEKYDEMTVFYKGEIIGDIMARGEFAWINVRDEDGAIGVFCPKDLTQEIEFTGGYKFSGDIVSVRGVFHRACPEHGGDTDIHAEKITVIHKGKAISHPLERRKVNWSIILPAIALALAIIHFAIRRVR